MSMFKREAFFSSNVNTLFTAHPRTSIILRIQKVSISDESLTPQPYSVCHASVWFRVAETAAGRGSSRP